MVSNGINATELTRTIILKIAPLDLILEDHTTINSLEISLVSNFFKNNATKVLSMAETVEPTPIASIEWLEVISLFLNRERVAKDVVTLIEYRYECAAAKALTVYGAIGYVKKKVLYVSFFNAGFGGYYGVSTCANNNNVWCALVNKVKKNKKIVS